MGEGRITITIKPRQVERVFYWVIIIILSALLMMSYLKDTVSTARTSQAAPAEQDVGAHAPAEQEAPAVEETGTCTDGKKNQDETGVDCGGSCTGCKAGYTCKTADDCAGDYCVSNKCTNTKPVTLSGEIELTITGVKTEKVSSGAVKVTEVSYQVKNGKQRNMGQVTGKVFVKSKRDSSYCLSQLPSEETSCPKEYALFHFTGPRTGETLKDSVELKNKYTGGSLVTNWGASTYYEIGDDFNVFLYLYDESGEPLGVSAFRTVKG